MNPRRLPNWFFPDSWYILGLSGNTRRQNVDTKFPTEAIIDLNATYPGKSGMLIHWEFYQSGTPNTQPCMDAYFKAM